MLRNLQQRVKIEVLNGTLCGEAWSEQSTLGDEEEA